MNPDSLRYAGFWPRLGSMLLDRVFWFSAFICLYMCSEHCRLFNLYVLMPVLMVQLTWNVYLVRRFGGTPGKLIMGIRIRKLDGEPVDYREAMLRYLPALLLGLLTSIAAILAAMKMSDQQFAALPIEKRSVHLDDLAPGWSPILYTLDAAWTWSELLVLLTNRQRRALHDFIAGTVVVYASSLPKTEPAEAEPGLLTAHDF